MRILKRLGLALVMVASLVIIAHADISVGERSVAKVVVGYPAIAIGGSVAVIKQGLLITAYHVIGDSEDLYIMYRGDMYSATVLAASSDLDVALLSTNAPVPPLEVAEEYARIGSRVYIMGYPFNKLRRDDRPFTSFGQVRGYAAKMFINIDALVGPGNSGGPVLTTDMKVVGILTQIQFNKHKGHMYAQAVPIQLALEALGL